MFYHNTCYFFSFLDLQATAVVGPGEGVAGWCDGSRLNDIFVVSISFLFS